MFECSGTTNLDACSYSKMQQIESVARCEFTIFLPHAVTLTYVKTLREEDFSDHEPETVASAALTPIINQCR